MLSRKFEPKWVTQFRWQQNRFSIVLSLLRRSLSLEEYDALLRIHYSSRQLFRSLELTGDFEKAWVREVRGELDSIFARLEVGEFSYMQLSRLLHLYRDLFLIGEVRRRIQKSESRIQKPELRIQKYEVGIGNR